jgi:sterol desaturase/sphingolipid hydroxylase (fatty acid hydroxylase superfamily)/creatinine amidohydrolase/Fe(II)-dependent formamide hydrolase-like protein
MEFLQTIFRPSLAHWLAVIVPSQRIFVLYLLMAVVLAFVSYLSLRAIEAANRPANTEKGFFRYLIDTEILTHKSSLQDYRFFIINGLIYYGILSQFLVGMHTFSNVFIDSLIFTFGPLATPVFEVTPWSVVIYTVVAVLVFDFAVFILHYLHHRIPLLWEFHKVHHSAEVLTPITLYRMHPVDLFLTGLAATILTGLAFAIFFYLTGKEPSPYTLFNLNIIVFVFYLMGYNLRHSHIWLNYPAWLSRVFVSPAQHQIHHSSDPKHFDKNMGLIFSFWDGLFGTLYIPRTFEKLKYGLNRTDPNPYKTVKELYVTPLRNAMAVLFNSKDREDGGYKSGLVAVTIAAFLIIYSAVFIWDRFVFATQFTLPSVHMEDLTWTEVDAARQRGYNTVLIPTGGTEQNGPHAILGKHNYIVKYTSGRIAEAVGKMLVAPVMAYVPEGAISPVPTGHMRFPGTVSLPEPVFEQVLEAAAGSYKAHGFKTILIMGDSGDSMAAQDAVALRLSKAWQTDGVRVVHIDKYYKANGQIDWLQNNGYSMSDIGRHAGIRDTSELMAVTKNGVRSRPFTAQKNGQTGVDGRPMLASKKIGEAMLELKIDAAIEEIRAERGVNERGTAIN